MRRGQSQTLRTHFNLQSRLFAGYVENGALESNETMEGLEQEGGLPYAGITANQNHRTRYHSTTQNPVQFADS